MQLSTIGPASDAARAQLLLVLLILALALVALISIPAPSHGLTFDMGLIPEHLTPTMSADQAGFIQHHSRRARQADPPNVLYYTPAPRPGPNGPRHSLELLPSGGLLFASRRIGPMELRLRLPRTDGWVDFRPHPEARYEDFVEVLAAVARSDFEDFRLDNSRYAKAFEEAAAQRP